MAALKADGKLTERTFDHTWEIKNLANVCHNESIIDNTKTEIQCEENNVVYAKFVVGLKVCKSGNTVRFYWKIVHESFCLADVQASVVIDALRGDGTNWCTFMCEANAILGVATDIEPDAWYFPWTDDCATYINSDGSWTLKIKLTLKNLPDLVDNCKDEEFELASKKDFIQNMTALIGNELGSDVKILTQDKKELFAHKAILCAQCPVFASMFGSDFLESMTGVVNVDEISAKPMRILLHFWYTGELLPSWKDDDTVVEFTYAAGKYQMTNILKMLDKMLGWTSKVSDMDVELLRVVQQLSLKNAEARILKLVIEKINQVKNGAELLGLFLLTTDSFDEGSFTFSQVLRAFDDVLSENNDKEVSFRDIELLALACKNGVQNVENKLLNPVIDTVNKVDSAEKLFGLFDIQNEKTIDCYKAGDLLVRANPT